MKLQAPVSALAAALLVAMVGATTYAAPKKASKSAPADPQKDEREAQIEYAKQLYGEGEAALEAKDYPLAVEKFELAYRYAPDLHLFTYNIAYAAEQAGQCQKARTHYQMFIDLVQGHPKESEARKSLEILTAECAYDQESLEKVQTVDLDSRKKDRAKVEAERALNESLKVTRRAAAMYESVASSNGGAQPFKKIGKAKTKQAKKILKLMASHGVESQAANAGEEAGEGDDDTQVPETLPEACRAAAALEKRSAKAYAAVLEHYDTRQMYRAMDKFQRQSEGRFRNAFTGTCPKK